MINLCTISDKNYVYKALALYKSLCNTVQSDFTLHYLCMDDETFDMLGKRDFVHMKRYRLSTLELLNPELLQAKQNPASKYGTQYSQYAWCLTPWFTNFILNNKVPVGEKLLYVDSDIYFYQSPQLILNAIGNKSVGIHTHRFSGKFNDELDTGWYNVGVVCFTNDTVGVDISNKWKKWLLDPANPYYEKYGTCGDQKYLNLFIALWGEHNVCVFDQDAGIQHGAPWCCNDIAGKQLHFYHFSHFNCDIAAGTWRDSEKGEWAPAQHAFIRPLYQQYNEAIIEAYRNINRHMQ